MNKILLVLVCLLPGYGLLAQHENAVLRTEDFRHYINRFNSADDESIKNAIPNAKSWDWMQDNIPWFECPDKQIEEIYYYRWWVFRKHIKETPAGFVITEFLPDVGHAAKYNTIACAAGLHTDEGKWLKDQSYISDYLRFWFSADGNPRQYSTWLVNSVYNYCKHTGSFALAEELYPVMAENYRSWEKSNLHESGLFWSYDDRDGGEYSISGSGLRPTLNSFMYADALSLSKIAAKLGKKQEAAEFEKKAKELKALFQNTVWDARDEFFCTLPLEKKEDELATDDHREVDPSRHVRELYGYFPWRFMLPDNGYEKAWSQMLDENGFKAPYGPTTAEQRHPLFMKNRIKRCQWDGSSWPFATSITLGGMINLLRYYDQDVISKANFLELMKTYTQSQYRTLPYGEQIPWIGESLHPHSGIWLSRAIALEMKSPLVAKRHFGDKNAALVRGKDYNHSSYCDLVISGLAGMEINEDGSITIDPLLPDDTWDWFCLDGISYKGKTITVVYDSDGKKYGRKAGLSVLMDGNEVAHSATLKAVNLTL